MKKSIMRATLPTPPGQTLVKQLGLLKTCGFDGIQLGVHQVGELTLATPDADVTKLAKACRDAGLEPHSIYGGITFFREDEADRKRGLEDARHVLEIASLIGAKTILIHPGQLTSAIPYDDCWKYALDGLRSLKEKAEATHLRLGLENVWNKFLTVVSRLRRMGDRLPRQGDCHATCHFLRPIFHSRTDGRQVVQAAGRGGQGVLRSQRPDAGRTVIHRSRRLRLPRLKRDAR